jgi:oligopeptide/dipeptide ABC transporter ATP-binding protein
VDNISFELHEGEFVGLVGESGCGKSVTALALLGLIPDARAEVSAASLQLAGRDLDGLPEKSMRAIRGGEIAMIFQEPASALDPVFTIGRQISYVIRRHKGVKADEARRQALQALEQGGFPEPEQVYRAYPHHLSGGMQQLALVAMAIATRPRVLIADEPTTALDVTTQALVLERLRALRDSAGTAILMPSHDLGVVANSCSRVLVMYCGRIIEQAEYETLYSKPRHPYTAGLLASVPRIRSGSAAESRLPLTPIPGQVPALSELPPGCHFAPRCAYASGHCEIQQPKLEPCGNSTVACHHPR